MATKNKKIKVKNKNINTYDLDKLFKEYKTYISHDSEAKVSLESFTEFLSLNGLSTVHAEELFKYHNTPEKFEKIAYDDFKMRKMHPKRDFMIKKVAVPAAITTTAVGATIGAIAGSGLVGGSTVMGFIPVSGTPGLTEMASSLTGATMGLISTPIVIKSKGLLTKAYYRAKAKKATRNIEDYKNGTAIENLNISKLISQTEKTNHSILESSGLKKHVLNAVNRNRIHQIAEYTKELLSDYYEIEQTENIDPKLKAETLKPIYEMLLNVQDYILNNVLESKTHAMLTCQEKKGGKHSYMIENVDIYASLKIYVDRIARIDAEHTRQTQLKDAKRTTKNLNQKKAEAYKLVNGEKFLSKMLNFEKEYAKYVATPGQGIAVMKTYLSDDEQTSHLVLANGKDLAIPASAVDTTKTVSTIKAGKSKVVITYEDGSTSEIVKKGKTIPEMETARIALVEKLLQDPEFVAALKSEGFKTITINKLVEKINEWRENTDEKFKSSGKVKVLYTYAIDKINNETETTHTL